MLRQHDLDSDSKLSANEIGLSAPAFRQLDTDNDGKLTETELTSYRQQPPDADWVIRFGKMLPGTENRRFSSGRVQIHLWVNDGKLPRSVAEVCQLIAARSGKVQASASKSGEGLVWLTPFADRDSNGSVGSEELKAWLDLQQQIAKGQILLTVLGDGGLFELLDVNHDGALSIRELRSAWQRISETRCVSKGGFQPSALPHVILAAASQGYPDRFGSHQRSGPDWFLAMDRNGDGAVSRQEFIGASAVFQRLDSDRDGLLDAEEAEASQQHKGDSQKD
jgi:Ca2+-binding EF-hand superfamily protein